MKIRTRPWKNYELDESFHENDHETLPEQSNEQLHDLTDLYGQ